MKQNTRNKNSSSVGYWLVSIIIIAILGVLAWVFFMPNTQPTTTGTKATDSTDYITLEDMTEQEKEDELKNIQTSISDVVLLEAKETMKFSVLEQRCSVEQTIDDSWFNWDIFKKTKKITYEGIGYFVVDLSKITKDDVEVNTDSKIVTVTVPNAQFDHVDIDISKSGFTKTDTGLLRYGEIKLTSEQQTILMEKAEKQLERTLKNDAAINAANASAKDGLKKLFTPIVTSVAPEYSVAIVIK